MPLASGTWRITRSARQLGEHLGERRRELRVHDDRRRPGVVEQVAQLLGDVAVVDVERGDAGLQAAEHRLEVLVAVVQVDGEVVLAGLVAGKVGPLGVAAEPGADEVVGQPVGALGDVGPGQPAVAEHEALGVGAQGGDAVEHRAEIGLSTAPRFLGHGGERYEPPPPDANRPTGPTL